MVQPQDVVTLNGIESKDDKGISSYLWQMLTVYPHAVIEVTPRIKADLHTPLSGEIATFLSVIMGVFFVSCFVENQL